MRVVAARTVTPTAFPARWRTLMAEHGGVNVHDSWWSLPSLAHLREKGLIEFYESELGPQWTWIEWKGDGSDG